jgi:hypothetical protein
VAVAAIRKINKETPRENEAKRRRGERIEMPLPLTPKIPFSIDISDPEPPRRDNDGLHKRRGIWYYSLEVGGPRRFFSTKTRNYTEARKIRAGAIKALESANALGSIEP